MKSGKRQSKSKVIKGLKSSSKTKAASKKKPRSTSKATSKQKATQAKSKAKTVAGSKTPKGKGKLALSKKISQVNPSKKPKAKPAKSKKQARLESSKSAIKKIAPRKKMPRNRWVDGEREAIIYLCGRCKKQVELFLPAKVVCSRCGNVMKTQASTPA